jgi:hypothetical protein
LIVTVLATLGIGTPLLKSAPPSTRQTPPTVAPHTESRAASGNENYPHSAEQLLEDFFDTAPDLALSNRPWSLGDLPSIRGNGPWPARDDRGLFEIELLIATVPEPSSSPLRYEFDSYLAAIQLAAGRAGYTLNSFDLPWLDQTKESSSEFRLDQEIDIEQETGKDITSALRRDAGRIRPRRWKLKPDAENGHRSEREAGLLLFRRDNDSRAKSLLLVFIVGETPTRGINKAALRDALDQTAWLSGWKALNPSETGPAYLHRAVIGVVGSSHGREKARRSGDSDELRIMGPTFSGSARSMRNTLGEWLYSVEAGPKRIRIVSGTATAIGDSLTNRADPRIEFSAVRIPDSAIWQRARDYFAMGSDSHPHIAVLSDNTAYGSNEAVRPDVLNITFPMHISGVRTAFGRADTAVIPPGPDLTRKDIPLADESGQQQRDVIPQLSGRSAAYDELLLTNILSTISSEHIRYVGVVATDVEDLVFLVSQIRAYCPESVVFTTSADLRFVHSEVNADLVGMLVFSTYPLFSANQNWTYPFKGESRRIQFPNEEAEGIFNATLTLIGDPGKVRDDLVEYSEPFKPSPRPALWLGVVGHNNIWPLSIWPLAFEKKPLRFDHVLAAQPRGEILPIGQVVGAYPSVVLAGFLLLSLVCLAVSVVLLSPVYHSDNVA